MPPQVKLERLDVLLPSEMREQIVQLMVQKQLTNVSESARLVIREGLRVTREATK